MLDSTSREGFPGWHARIPASQRKRGNVVFLHGAFGDHTVFGNYAATFAAAGWEGFAFSRRGRHGVPPEDARGVTFDEYLEDSRRIVDSLGEPPVLVGHSLGGLLAQKLAEEGRARAIVLVASAPPSMLTAQAVALPTFAPRLPRIMAGLPFDVPAGACRKLALNCVPDETDRERIHGTLNRESGIVYRQMMLGRIRVDASKVRCPVLVVGGDRDRIISLGLLRGTARHYGVDANVYEGHGHWLPEEPGWDAIAARMLRWLEDPKVVASAPASPSARPAPSAPLT
jgi:pimeloyl-ACP methyl ester carboxylesterase